MIPSNLLTARFNSNHITSSWSLGCVMLCHHISSSWFSKFFVHVAATKTLHDPPECQTFWNRCVSRCHLTSPNDTCETIDETSRSAFRIFSGSFQDLSAVKNWTHLDRSMVRVNQHLNIFTCVGSPPRRFFDDCRPVLPCISNLSTEYVRWNCLESLEHHKRLISSEKSWKNATAPHNLKSTVVQYACCMPFAILLHAKGQGPERSSWILRRPFLGIQKTRSEYAQQEYHHSKSRGVDMVWKIVGPPCWCSGLIRSPRCIAWKPIGWEVPRTAGTQKHFDPEITRCIKMLSYAKLVGETLRTIRIPILQHRSAALASEAPPVDTAARHLTIHDPVGWPAVKG